MGRRGKSGIMPRPHRNKVSAAGKAPRSPKARDSGTSDVEQIEEDNFAEAVEFGAQQLAEKRERRSTEASPKPSRRGRKPSATSSDSEPSAGKKTAAGGRNAINLASSSPKSSPVPRLRTKAAAALPAKKTESHLPPPQQQQSSTHSNDTFARKRPVGESTVLEELREKFQQLTMLRSTAAEALLDEYKRAAEDRIQAAERVISALKQENEALRRSTASKPESAGRLSDVSQLSVAGAASRPVVDLYASLSGMEVVADADAEQLFHCTLRGRLGEFTFDLALDEDGAQYCYTPTFSPKSAISGRLPAYLQEEIVFDCDQLQLFFWRALNFLMTAPK